MGEHFCSFAFGFSILWIFSYRGWMWNIADFTVLRIHTAAVTSENKTFDTRCSKRTHEDAVGREMVCHVDPCKVSACDILDPCIVIRVF